MANSNIKLMATNSGLASLLNQVKEFGLNNIPPATLALIAGQVALFMDPGYFPPPEDVCISSYHVYYLRDWLRMLLSSFYHGSDMHLYYNMLSLLYKGSWLEKKFGSPYFVYLVGVFTALTNAMYVLLGLFLSWLFNDESYLRSCAIGFSGVLFGMKVLTSHYAPHETQYFMGIVPIPSRYIYWLELVLIQLATPNVSFVGHLSGILVGLTYITGPLKFLMELFVRPGDSSVDPPSGTTSPRQQSSAALNAGGRQQQTQARGAGQYTAGTSYRQQLYRPSNAGKYPYQRG